MYIFQANSNSNVVSNSVNDVKVQKTNDAENKDSKPAMKNEVYFYLL